MADKIDVIGDVKPHTVKKFELIAEYVKAWAYKLLNCQKCKGIVFIDCMSNSGIYSDINGNEVSGTPIRVSKTLSDIMINYYGKDAWLYFNDFSSEKSSCSKRIFRKILKTFILIQVLEMEMNY